MHELNDIRFHTITDGLSAYLYTLYVPTDTVTSMYRGPPTPGYVNRDIGQSHVYLKHR